MKIAKTELKKLIKESVRDAVVSGKTHNKKTIKEQAGAPDDFNLDAKTKIAKALKMGKFSTEYEFPNYLYVSNYYDECPDLPPAKKYSNIEEWEKWFEEADVHLADALLGHYDSMEDYAWKVYEDGLDEDTLRMFFDIKAFARTLEDEVVEEEGYVYQSV